MESFFPLYPQTTIPKMKLQLIPVAFAAFALAACGGSDTNNDPDQRTNTVGQTNTAPSGEERIYSLDPAASEIEWKGVMLGVKQHFGKVQFVDGTVTLQGGQLVDGMFTADLGTIAPEDSAYAPDDAEGGRRSDLIAHLKSGDFFDVENHPNATLDIIEVNGNTAKANFTVRGKTDVETIEDIQVTETNGEVRATGKMKFDRQKYGVSFSTGLQDAVISDDIELQVELVGRAQAS